MISNLWIPPYSIQKAYRLLYENPVCKVADTIALSLFHDRIIVNPYHFKLDDAGYEHLTRFNAFVLQYEADKQRWTLDLQYPYEIDRYRAINTNVPPYL